MPQPTARPMPVNVATTRGGALSGAAVAVVLSYTVPAARVSKLLSSIVTLTALAPTVAIQVVSGGVTTTLLSGATSLRLSEQQWLSAGDAVQVAVTALVALSTLDAYIAVEEYEIG